MAKSMAIITDAAHLLLDTSSFILAIIANEIASRPACSKFTYGTIRAEVLAALFSTFLILVLSAGLVYGGVMRIILFSRGQGPEVDGKIMTLVAAIGLLVNIAVLLILGHEHGHGHSHSHGHSHGHDHRSSSEEDLSVKTPNSQSHGHSHSHNHNHADNDLDEDEDNRMASTTTALLEAGSYGSVKEGAHVKAPKKKRTNINVDAAALHAVTDLVQSAGVLLTGAVIWWRPTWRLADPIITLVFALLICNSTRSLLRQALNVLLEGAPDSFDVKGLRQRLLQIKGVSDVHCLHVWSLTAGAVVVTAHIKAADTDFALRSAHAICEDVGVQHATIQVQRDGCEAYECGHPW
ncbi:unnamed protein product [Chrysoparadoxa australica]